MKKTLAYSFNVSSPVHFDRTGKADALDQDWIHPASRLNDFELIIVTRNTLYIQYEGIKHTVTTGEYLLLQPHLEISDTDMTNIRKGFQKSDCSFYWLHFRSSNVMAKDALYLDLINDGHDNILIPKQGRLKSPEKVLLQMIQLQDSIRNDYNPRYFDLLCTLILCEISSQNLLMRSEKSAFESSSTKRIFHDIKDYIAYCKNDNLKVSDIAERFDYNEKYLSRLFKKYEGISLKQYILKQKIENAGFLLLDSNLSIKEISDYLGFANYHTFERIYKKYTSMTPSEYRKLYAGRITNFA